MRLFYLISILCFLAAYTFANTHTITNTGLVYNPSVLTIQAGDTVVFQLSSTHDAVQVSEATYNANGATPLTGGFNVGFGGGQIVLTEPGIYYYVCTPHAGFGMKGRIIVQGETTSAESAILLESLKLSPNPVSNVLNVKFSTANNITDLSIAVIDIAGQRHLYLLNDISMKDDVFMLDVSELPSGVYFLEMRLQKHDEVPDNPRFIRATYKKFVKL